MTTQKTFKQHVRARMAKTGESYTAARHQLLGKAQPRAAGRDDDAGTPRPPERPAEGSTPPPTSDAAVRRATGRTHGEWFELLDGYGASERRHPEIAAWLQQEHGLDGWWAQSVTVAYERVRGLRAQHQMPTGFQVGAARTVTAGRDRVLRAFTAPEVRAHWLPDASLEQRRTTAAGTARFDWADPPSRLIVYTTEKGSDRTTVSVVHERLPDPASAERLKTHWRERLAALKTLLEEGDDSAE